MSFGLIMLSMTGCKPTASNDAAHTKTLDSIASGVLNIEGYQCKGTSKPSIQDASIVFDKTDPKTLDPEEKEEIRQAVKDYFSALPPSAESLFLKFGGQVFISNRVDELCASARYGKKADSTQGEVTEGCFTFVSDPKGKSAPIFTIIQAPKAKKIRYYGPQIFGYLYAQFYSRLSISSNGKGLEIATKEPMGLITRKEKIANAFLSDLLASREYKLDVLKQILGDNSASELRSNNSVPPLERLSYLKDEGRRQQVLDYIYANSFQSAHCNHASLEIAKSKFKQSSALFSEIDAAVVQISDTLTGSKSNYSPSISPSTANAEKAEFSLGGGEILSSIMPIFSKLQGLVGGDGQGGGIMNIFSSLLGGSGAGIGGLLQQSGLGNFQGLFANAFNSLSAGGCSGGSCPGVSGNCSGGSCTNCPNGSCGGSSGSCYTG
jgi:hypothetical protein